MKGARNDWKGRNEGTRGRRLPKPVTPERLHRAALSYLERYASSTENLRRVLTRRVNRSALLHGTDPEEGLKAIETILSRFQRSGLLDDRVFAEGRARSLHRAGHATRAIRQRLRLKGVDGETAEAAVESLREEQPAADLAAALRYARKRGLGPYRTSAQRAERRDRDLAALARRGFPLDLAVRVVDCSDPEALLEEAEENALGF